MPALLGFVLVGAAGAAAQNRMHPRWEIPGFDFSRDGAWRVKARRVAQRRAQLLAGGDFRALNAPLAAGRAGLTATSVMGTMTVPVVLFGYNDTDPSQMR